MASATNILSPIRLDFMFRCFVDFSLKDFTDDKDDCPVKDHGIIPWTLYYIKTDFYLSLDAERHSDYNALYYSAGC